MVDFSEIRAFLFDVDGVFTDGGVLCDLKGELYRTFDAKDGFAVRMACMRGYPVGIITGGRSRSITERFLTTGLKEEDVYLGARNKVEQLQDFCERHYLNADQILFIGDDIPDLEVMRTAGIGLCPSDAVEEVKAAADMISTRPGGRGCVRDAVERVLKAHADWNFDALEYKKHF